MKTIKHSFRVRSSVAAVAGAMGLMLALAASPASAVIISTTSFDLGTGNPGLSGFTGPYAHVVVDLTTSTTATITFTSLTNSGNTYRLGDGGSVAVNVNATSWTLGTINGSSADTAFTPGPWSNGGAGNEDGFGSFNQTINSFDGFQHSSDAISFALTDTSGTWADAASVLTGNADKHLAAAHIFVWNGCTPGTTACDALTTGFATDGGGGGGGNVPEPATLALLGSALLGLALTRRRRG